MSDTIVNQSHPSQLGDQPTGRSSPISSTQHERPVNHPSPGPPSIGPGPSPASTVTGQYQPGYPPQGFAYPVGGYPPYYAPPTPYYPNAYSGFAQPPAQGPAPQHPPYLNTYAQGPYGHYATQPPASSPGGPGSSPVGGFAFQPGPVADSTTRMPEQPGLPSSAISFGTPLWYLGTPIVDPNAPAAPLGAIKVPGYDPHKDHDQLMQFCQRDLSIAVYVEPHFANILFPLSIQQRDALNDFTIAKTGKDLTYYIDRHIGTDAKYIFRALVQGPLGYDVELLRKAMEGLGTNEMLLTELILNRSQDELKLLIAAYKNRFGKDLVDSVKSELSGMFERMFVMALNTQRAPDNIPVDSTQVNIDVAKLYQAVKTKEELPFIEIFVNRSHPHLASVITAYSKTHKKSLSKVVKKQFSGDLERGLLYILHGVKAKRDGQGVWRDAKMLEATMAGMGTRDKQLIYRVMRAQWNPQRFEAIKAAYLKRYGKTLERRIKGETSGQYRDVLLMIVRSTEPT